MDTLTPYLLVLFAYALGSVSSAVITAKLMRLPDPRTSGSGNPGATNVLRTGGKLAAIITLTGDVLKGLIPVLVALHFHVSYGWVAVVSIAAFMGHLYPVFFGFKGGKGVATAIGVFAGLSLPLLGVFIGVWLLTAIITRYSSLAALIATAVTGLASFAIFKDPAQHQLIGGVLWIVAFLFQRHRENLERLKAGTESKIGSKK
ncbi:MAG TPA: acyl-phosphate glycerol 3-phosphate acyltransferase [Gammaproteobacteria bacterium]|jgi:glycerol-3-phosphate acyltransferase PlsY|nr:acyl-phosphate glycerol 3-phosphate acyltransferase [Gammaproteobacteria bacterium]